MALSGEIFYNRYNTGKKNIEKLKKESERKRIFLFIFHKLSTCNSITQYLLWGKEELKKQDQFAENIAKNISGKKRKEGRNK